MAGLSIPHATLYEGGYLRKSIMVDGKKVAPKLNNFKIYLDSLRLEEPPKKYAMGLLSNVGTTLPQAPRLEPSEFSQPRELEGAGLTDFLKKAILSISNKPNKKYTIVIYNNGRKKSIHFGSKSIEDYTQHRSKNKKAKYLEKHQENTNPYSVAFWNQHLLWNKPSIDESIKDIKKKHNIHTIKGAGFVDFVKSIPGRITGLITGRGNNYPPKCREFLKRNGNNIITSLTVYRAPVQSFIEPILNAVSVGKFTELMAKNGFDTMFHLYCRIDFANSNCRLEKNEVISINQPFKNDNDAEELNIPLKESITINTLLENTQKYMGGKYFTYSAFGDNNCQNYILSILEANNLSSPEYKNFIYQDMTDFRMHLPSSTQTIAQGTTDLASRFDVLLHGKGMKKIRI